MKPKLLTTLPEATPASLAADALAGITVAMVAIPLSLAIAIASGATPAQGLVTAIVAGFLISLLGGSRVQIGGPTGAFIVVVYGVVAEHGMDGLVLATLMAGAILVVGGLLRLGRYVALVPPPVVEGFTVGIAIVIGASQLKDLFGLDLAKVPADFLPKVAALWAARDSFNAEALAIGVGTAAAIWAIRRVDSRIPGPLIAVASAAAIVAWASLPVDTIAGRYGALPDRLPWPHLPVVTTAKLIELLPSALVIAFLAAIESLLSALVADRMVGGRHRPDAEILAQGAANIGSALFGGLPATGAIARTATNVRAGGRSPVAGLVHALVILGVMMLAAPLAGALPMAALAGLLLLTAWNMSEPHRWRARLAEPLPDRLLLLLTMALTVLSDLVIAIAVGTALGLLLRRLRGGPPAELTPPDR